MRSPNVGSASHPDGSDELPEAARTSPAERRRGATARQLRTVAFSFAIAGGLVAMLFSTWPLPVLHGYERSVFVTWGVVGDVVGPVYFAGAYLIRRRLRPAPVVLTMGGLLMIGAWLATGRLVAVSRLDAWWLGLTVDLLPVMLAAAAAWLVASSGRPWLAPQAAHE